MTALLRCHPLQPVNFVRGENCHLLDDAGNRYTDFESGSWACILGHQHPSITEVLQRQAGQLIHLGVRTPNHLAERAAEALLELIQEPRGAVSFLNSGSEAVEFAIQAAKAATGRKRLLTLRSTYLGAYGSATLRDRSEWIIADPQEHGVTDLEKLIAGLPLGEIAAFVLEPGGNGPCFARFPEIPLVQALAQAVSQAGGLVVVNEVTTGLGRTGAWFAHERYGLRPDLIALGKSLGNGYPVSAVLVRAATVARLEEVHLYHAQSHQNNPLGCAVALEVLRVLREEDWIRRGAEKGQTLLKQLTAAFGRHPYVREIRGRGMLFGIELKPEAPLSGAELQQLLWKRRLITGGYPRHHPAGTGIRLDPSLSIGAAETDSLLEALQELLG